MSVQTIIPVFQNTLKHIEITLQYIFLHSEDALSYILDYSRYAS